MSHARRSRRGWGRLRKLPSGRWQAGYTGVDGVRYNAPATFDTKDGAQAWLHSERKLIDLDEWTPPTARTATRAARSKTFAEYSAEWLDNRKVKGRAIKPRTRSHYQSLLDRVLLPTFGSRRLPAITAEVVRDWHAAQGDRTPTQTSHAYGLLRSILADAEERGLIATNPARIRGASTSRRAHKVEPLPPADLLTLADAMPEQHRLMVLLSGWCGLRFGELVELRRKDLDLTNALVKVRRGAVRVGGRFVVGEPKSDAGIRDVDIPPHLLPEIREHLRRHVDRGRESLLFPAANGGHLQPSTLYGSAPKKAIDPDTGETVWEGDRGFYRARVVAGHPDLRWHDLRHSGAVLAAIAGATLPDLMQRLGHSTRDAAMVYQHVAAGQGKRIAERLSKLAGEDS